MQLKYIILYQSEKISPQNSNWLCKIIILNYSEIHCNEFDRRVPRVLDPVSSALWRHAAGGDLRSYQRNLLTTPPLRRTQRKGLRFQRGMRMQKSTSLI